LAEGIPARLTAPEGRKFGLTLGIAFSVLAAVSLWRGHTIPVYALATVGAAFLFGALLVPTRLGGVQRAWMSFALLLSKVTTPIFLGIVYFLVITPIGLLMRVFGKQPLRRPATESFFVARSASDRRGGMHNQF
jgi:hypothetical protein